RLRRRRNLLRTIRNRRFRQEPRYVGRSPFTRLSAQRQLLARRRVLWTRAQRHELHPRHSFQERLEYDALLPTAHRRQTAHRSRGKVVTNLQGRGNGCLWAAHVHGLVVRRIPPNDGFRFAPPLARRSLDLGESRLGESFPPSFPFDRRRTAFRLFGRRALSEV